MEAIVLILGKHTLVLFDSGVSHTFIALSIVKTLNLKTKYITNPLVVSNPVGGPTYLILTCKDLLVDIFNIDFKCNAYVLSFERYGFILGMD